MRSEPAKDATPETDLPGSGCWDQDQSTDETFRAAENTGKRSRTSKQNRPTPALTPDLELTDSSSVSDDMAVSSTRANRRYGGSAAGLAMAAAQRRKKPTMNARDRNMRRLESNERERMRMHSLNDAFQSLREVIPHIKKERRLSKIETLTLAKNYVMALTNVICEMRGEESPYAAALAGLDTEMKGEPSPPQQPSPVGVPPDPNTLPEQSFEEHDKSFYEESSFRHKD